MALARGGLTPKEAARNMILGAIDIAIANNDLAEEETPSMAAKIKDHMEKELEGLENRWGFSR